MAYKGFSQVELRRPTRSTFDLSHEKRVSSRIGKLTPILITETMPNDTFYGSSEVLIKIAPLAAPMYQRLNCYVHYFFIPNRLLWKDWETFITGGRLGEAVSSPPVPPYFSIFGALSSGLKLMDVGSLSDYLGVPPLADADAAAWGGRTIDAMPYLAFYKVFYDYYRDRNYIADDALLPAASGNNATYGLMSARYRCWQHDYFTSALPWTQRGSEVLMPLQGTGSVTYKDISSVFDELGNPAPANATLKSNTVADGDMTLDTGSTRPYGRIENIQEVELVSSDVSINDLRRAMRLQEWLERNALAGSLYNESIMAHFGRKTSDGRLQRAEYLGGGKAVIQISEVMTTAYSDDAEDVSVPPGNPVGRGSAYANTNKFSYNCEEHGFIIAVLSAMPTSGYMQGLPRMFQNRNTFLDYPWPSFAHLGEQEVYDNEIYMDGASVPVSRADQPIFGYQSRYADWKYIPSSSHGDFRSTLDYWHMTRKFTAQPNLGSSFVTFEDELQDRVFNVAGIDTLWMYIYNKLNVKRSLPYFGTPMT